MEAQTGKQPRVIVLAGPNGAGKTTAAGSFLQAELGVTEFVNADVIAQGLSGFRPEAAALQAGRVMLARLKELAAARADFAFETTLASRSFAPWIRDLCRSGYAFDLFFFWLSSADLAVARVAQRVRGGGHGVPEETVRRRYRRGMDNFFHQYQPISRAWWVYDNSTDGNPRLVAAGSGSAEATVADAAAWSMMKAVANVA
jgi:predicted ABC-type ATPase